MVLEGMRKTRTRAGLWTLGVLWCLGARAGDATLVPDQRGAFAADRNFDLQRLSLDLDLDPVGRSVSGTATLELERLAAGPLVLQQVALDISKVDTGALASRWWIEGERLIIEVEGDAPTVVVHYSAKPRNGLHFREASRRGPDRWDEIWSQGEDIDHRHWFPSWDHPNDRFVYQGDFTAPEDWTVITNSGHEMVNYLEMVAAGRYERHAHAQMPSLSVYVPPGTAPAAVSHVLDSLPEMMTHFTGRTGVPYPWGDYRQIFVQRFLYAGMENTSATIETVDLLVDERVIATRPSIERVVAHELAHQWYGDLLTCRSWRELWLNEGFATFFTADWVGHSRGADHYAELVSLWFRHSQSGPAMAHRFHQGADKPSYYNVYSKGAAVLQMLRVMLGDALFWKGIAHYTRDWSPGLVETRDLQRAMEDVSGRHLGWFFQQWVELPHVPRLEISDRYRDGTLILSVQQPTDEGVPHYTLRVQAEVGTEDGPLLIDGWLDDSELELRLELDAPPRYVAFDPQGGVLGKIEQKQDPDRWVAQLGSAAPYARLRAIEALAETDRAEALSALLMDASESVPIRKAAVRALGEQRAQAPLIAAAAEVQSEPVRQAIAGGLGKCSGSEVATALKKMVRQDNNPDVQGAALRALAAVDPAAALGLARSRTRAVDREGQELARSAMGVLGEHGSISDLRLLLASGAPDRMAKHGLEAAARLAEREQDEARRTQLAARVARVAEGMLLDVDLRTREAAVRVLGRVGDERSIPALEQLRRIETVASLRRSARAAIRRITARDGPPDLAPNEEAARIDELETRMDELETTLERWDDAH